MTQECFFENFEDMPDDLWRWSFFTPLEMRCRGTNSLLLIPAFMDKITLLRSIVGFPIPIISGYRSPKYNSQVSSTGNTGPHTTAMAIDVGVYGKRAYELVKVAISMGFTGIGENQKGLYKDRFIHLDVLEDGPGCPRPWKWTY